MSRKDAKSRSVEGKWILAGIGLLTALFAVGSLTLYRFVWSEGTTLLPLAAAGALEIAASVAVWAWLWRTRDPALARLPPATEISRHLRLGAWLLVYVYAVFWTASLFAQQDTSWTQTVVGTEAVPEQAIILTLSMPAYLGIGGSAYLYARTRLPEFARGVSVPFLVAIAGPFFFQPARSHWWDEAFSFADELYVALYWLVLVAWAFLGLGGILAKMIRRVAQLLG